MQIDAPVLEDGIGVPDDLGCRDRVQVFHQEQLIGLVHGHQLVGQDQAARRFALRGAAAAGRRLAAA